MLRCNSLTINGQVIEVSNNELASIQQALDEAVNKGTMGYQLKVDLTVAINTPQPTMSDIVKEYAEENGLKVVDIPLTKLEDLKEIEGCPITK